MSSERRRSSDVILSYYDSLLRQKDIELLEGPHWINDNLLGFYFEYLNMQKLGDYNLSQSVIFVCPEVTQLIKLSFDVTHQIFLNPLDVRGKKFVFFPLNNSKSRIEPGGTHWTLLVYSKVEQMFYHFDSASCSDQAELKEFTKNLYDYFLVDNSNTYVEVNCPQQTNSIDCGLFVMCFADVLLEHIAQYSKIENCDLSQVPELVSKKRQMLLELIRSQT